MLTLHIGRLRQAARLPRRRRGHGGLAVPAAKGPEDVPADFVARPENKKWHRRRRFRRTRATEAAARFEDTCAAVLPLGFQGRASTYEEHGDPILRRPVIHESRIAVEKRPKKTQQCSMPGGI